jgi:hypothetical protein
MTFVRGTFVVRCFWLMGAELAHESDGAAEKIAARFGGRGIHQLEIEGEGSGFAAAFGGGVVLAGQHVARAAEEIGVVGRRRSRRHGFSFGS